MPRTSAQVQDLGRKTYWARFAVAPELVVLSGLLAKSSRGLDSAIRAHNEGVAAVEGGLSHGARELGRLGVGGLDRGSPAPSVVAVRSPRAGPVEAA